MHSRPDSEDLPRSLLARDKRHGRRRECAGSEVCVYEIDTDRVIAYENLAGTGPGRRDLFKLENFWTAVTMDADRSHRRWFLSHAYMDVPDAATEAISLKIGRIVQRVGRIG
jgi:hypothetical protein